jgi:carbonic anhydrase
MAKGELTVSAWVYEIGTGEVRISDDGSNEFVPVA